MRGAYLIAAAFNILIMPFLPPHYSPINFLVVALLLWLAWTRALLHRSRAKQYLLLAGVTAIAIVGSIAAVRSDGMLYTFLGLCLIYGFILQNTDENESSENI